MRRRPRNKQISVLWCKTPVEIAGVAKKDYETETAFQIYCVTWIRKTYPNLKFHHSANEREGGKAGLLAKLMGQSKGFPDFYCPRLKLALELKVMGRGATAEQLQWLQEFQNHGYTTAVVHTFEQFKEIVLGKVNI